MKTERVTREIALQRYRDGITEELQVIDRTDMLEVIWKFVKYVGGVERQKREGGHTDQ